MSGLFGSAASAAAATSNTIGDLKNDVALSNPPEDTISGLSFSPAADFLAVSSWDKKVRIYQIAANGSSEGKHMYDHDAPVLSVDFSKVCWYDLDSCLHDTNPYLGWPKTRIRRRRQAGQGLRPTDRSIGTSGRPRADDPMCTLLRVAQLQRPNAGDRILG